MLSYPPLSLSILSFFVILSLFASQHLLPVLWFVVVCCRCVHQLLFLAIRVRGFRPPVLVHFARSSVFSCEKAVIPGWLGRHNNENDVRQKGEVK